MKIIIIEDETAAVVNLRALIAQVCPDAEVVATLESVTDTIAWFSQNPAPDLTFMDIHLADGDAFRIFEKIDVLSPIIFTTAYDQYALEAFRVNSIDYLLKPIKTSDLTRAIEKFQRLTQSDKRLYVNRISNMAERRNHIGNAFLLHIKDKIIPLKPEEIAFCYTFEEHVTIHTKDGRKLPYEKSLDTIMSALPDKTFFRANRQFIISRDVIADISVWFGSRLSVNLSIQVPERIIISKARVPEFKRWLTGETK